MTILIPSLPSMFTQYLSYLRARKSSKTVRDYQICLKKFEQYLSGRTLTIQEIFTFQEHLLKTLKPVTVNYYLISIRSYLRWLKLNDLPTIDYTKVELMKAEKYRGDYLNKSELQRFYNEIKTDSLIGLRNKAMLVLLYVSGLRVHELTSLNRSDIDFDTNEIPIRGKGGRHRTIYLTPDSSNLLNQYLSLRHDTHPALFIGHKRSFKRLSDVSVQLIVRATANQAKIAKKVTPHTLRRSFATNLHLNGCPLIGIKEMLGHASVLTTQVYINIAPPELKGLHEKYLTSPYA